MARWTAEEMAIVIEARCAGEGGAPIDAVTTDSREARAGAAFFALDGARVRGGEFVPDAFGAGCSVVVVPSDWAGEIPAGRAALHVDDPLVALARLASAARAAWSAPVLAVTGSVGKTTVKEMTATILEVDGPVHRTPGNFNTVVGLARTILAADEAPRVAVLEVGASEPGEIARLAEIVAPTAAAVTNVAAAHLEGFGTLDGVAREKVALLRAVPDDGLRVIDGDDPRLAVAVRDAGLTVLGVGIGPGSGLRALDPVRTESGGTRFHVDGVAVELAVPGFHQVRNALVALAFARSLGIPLGEAGDRLRRFTGIAGRLVPRRLGGVLVCDDTYNANPASVAAALDWFEGVETSGRRFVALGDMLELGPDSERLHAEAGARVADLEPDLALFVGDESRAAFEEFQRRLGDRNAARWTPDSDEAARILLTELRAGDALLVKGSRGVAMERIVERLAASATRAADTANDTDAADPAGPAEPEENDRAL